MKTRPRCGLWDTVAMESSKGDWNNALCLTTNDWEG